VRSKANRVAVPAGHRLASCDAASLGQAAQRRAVRPSRRRQARARLRRPVVGQPIAADVVETMVEHDENHDAVRIGAYRELLTGIAQHAKHPGMSLCAV
jgi:hypothetical protein